MGMGLAWREWDGMKTPHFLISSSYTVNGLLFLYSNFVVDCYVRFHPEVGAKRIPPSSLMTTYVVSLLRNH